MNRLFSFSEIIGAAVPAAVFLSLATSLYAAPPDPLIDLGGGLSAVPGARVRNLEVFALLGKDQMREREYLSLSEALDRGAAKVMETGNVGELSIENMTKDQYVLVQAGDIVKGGRQDRCFQTDLILPPRSGPQPISSFCVEHGRWSGRGAEESRVFAKSDKQLVTSAQRYAAKRAKDQGGVWNEVERSRKALSDNTSKIAGKPVNVDGAASPTSLQLALENPDLAGAVKDIRSEIGKAFAKRTDVVGVAYAINGRLVNAEIYGQSELFSRMREKILDAAATEAIAELPEGKAVFHAVGEKELRTFLDFDGILRVAGAKPNSQTETRESETEGRVLFDTRDVDYPKAWVHRNVIVAEGGEPTVKSDYESGYRRRR
ncbi:MAG: hypothetical protein JO317_06375 [Verrucomicrobiae bacterium]|nr:hypothetical protein [Verrucomicrobiae bacterium]